MENEIMKNIIILVCAIIFAFLGVVLLLGAGDIMVMYMALALITYGIISCIYLFLWFVIYKRRNTVITYAAYIVSYYIPIFIIIATFMDSIIQYYNKDNKFVILLIPIIAILALTFKFIKDIYLYKNKNKSKK